jgi:hypothetical protein
MLFHDNRTVQRPGDDGSTSVIEALKILDDSTFGFEFKNRIVLPADQLNQWTAETGQPVKRQGVGKLAGTYPEKPLGMYRKRLFKFLKQIFDIDIKGQPGSVQVRLENTVDTVNRAVCAGVEDLIIATLVLTGSWTWFEEHPTVPAKIELTFTGRKITDIVFIETVWLTAFRDNRPGQTGSDKNISGAGEFQTGLFNIYPVNIYGRIFPSHTIELPAPFLRRQPSPTIMCSLLLNIRHDSPAAPEEQSKTWDKTGYESDHEQLI